MRILYVGQTSPGGTCRDRMESLGRLGHEVIEFNVSDYESPWRLLRSAQWRFSPRHLLRRLNHDLRTLRIESPVETIWIDKGVWVFPETLVDLKQRLKAQAIHFTPDPQLLLHRSPQFKGSIAAYDHVVTTKSFEVELYRGAGARRITLCQQSFCPQRYQRPESVPAYTSPLGFVGHCEAHYRDIVSALHARHSVSVWGTGWRAASTCRRVPHECIRGGGLYGVDYVNALASFHIGLGLLTKLVPEQHTTRTFEIPAAGAFLLAERTHEHEDFFLEGKEAEFFSSKDELLSKAAFYLEHESSRRQIAAAGRERCWRSGYDNDSVLGKILKELA